MKMITSLLLLSISGSALATPSASAVDWSQPPLACIENVVPRAASRPCLDLSHVKDLTTEIKEFKTVDDELYWTNPANKKGLTYCRSMEILRREDLKPGSFTAGIIQISWMRTTAVNQSKEKLAAIINSAKKYQMPNFILAGALMQESALSDLGISDDGGNFSCGAGQINLLEWCRWANKQSPERKTAMSWPQQAVECSGLQNEWVRPFHEIAMTRLNGLPGYRLNLSHFQNISFNDVKAKLPGSSPSVKQKNYDLTKSFINNCSKPELGIEAKAHELSELFRQHIPAGMKNREKYTQGQYLLQPQCQYKDTSGYYPLHMGWLKSVAAYNAGPRATETFEHYFRLKKEMLDKSSTYNNMTPQELVEGLYEGGRYNANTDRIDFINLSGGHSSNAAFKQCVMHQHVVRIAQHVTAPGADPLLITLNETNGCKKENPLSETRRKSSGFFN